MSKIKTTIHIRVRVRASAPREKVEKVAEHRYTLAVKEPAEDNRANVRVLDIIQGLYPQKRVRMIKGHHEPGKILEVSG